MKVAHPERVGTMLRGWRQRRHLSQLDLACEAEISTRHLSFVENGRAIPSREMVLKLSDQLSIPLRERNVLLTAAGYAAVYPQRSLSDPDLESARSAVDLILKGLDPYPCVAIDRHWTLVAANQSLPHLLAGVDPSQLEPPVNVLRLSLHPAGLRKRIVNLGAWRRYLLQRLHEQIVSTADATLQSLMKELRGYDPPKGVSEDSILAGPSGIVVPLQLRVGDTTLSMISTSMIFGSPVDVTLSELAIESFFPADRATKDWFKSNVT